jgi:hypothetical protein
MFGVKNLYLGFRAEDLGNNIKVEGLGCRV